MKKNRSYKLVIFTLISMCNFSTFGQSGFIELSLKCRVRVKTEFSNGNKEVNNGDLIVNISENRSNKYKYIGIKSSIEQANDISVSTGQSDRLKSFEKIVSDNSDENNYDVTNMHSYPGNRSINNRIYLNRNNGEIIVSHEFTSPKGLIQTSIGGSCEKIDTTKKKF